MARGFGSGGIYADPAFQMGMALGNAYGNLWAANAENRNREQMRELIRNQTGQMDESEIAQIAAMGDTQGVNPRAANTVEQAGASAAQQDPAAAYRQRLFAAGNATPQQQAAGVTGNIPGSYVARAANSTDEALNRIQQQDQLQRAGVAARNPLFSADDIAFAAQMAGVHEDVIEDFMPVLQKAAANNARETLLPGIMNDSYGYTNASGEYMPPDYKAAVEGILELGRYDPETAKALMSGAISSKDLYNARREEIARLAGDESYMRRLQMQDAVKQQQEEREFNRTVEALMQGGMSREQAESTARLNFNYGTGKRSGSKGSTQKPEIETKRFEIAKKRIDELVEKRQMSDLTPAEENELMMLTDYTDNVMASTYGYGNHMAGQATGGTQYGADAFIAEADKGLKAGMTAEQILQNMKTQGGWDENDAEYQIVAEYLNGKQRKNNQSQKPQQQADDDSWFDFNFSLPSLPSLSPTSPLLQPGENGMPTWANKGLWNSLVETGEMNRGTNGLPWFMQK